MFQLRDADPWANTASDSESSATADSIKSAVGSVFSFLTTPIAAAKDAAGGGTPVTPTTTTPTPGTKVTTTKPVTVWYKTPLGIAGILAGAFAGYKLYQRRKAKAA